MSKIITLYTFLLVFKTVESLQCILNNSLINELLLGSVEYITKMIWKNSFYKIVQKITQKRV